MSRSPAEGQGSECNATKEASDRSERFSHRRLRRSVDFNAVYQFRVRAYDSILTVCCAPHSETVSRLGLSVSRKVGGAVVRNRWKRLIREAARHLLPALPAGYDFVVIPKRMEVLPEYSAVYDSLENLLPWVIKKAKRQVAQERAIEFPESR